VPDLTGSPTLASGSRVCHSWGAEAPRANRNLSSGRFTTAIHGGSRPRQGSVPQIALVRLEQFRRAGARPAGAEAERSEEREIHALPDREAV